MRNLVRRISAIVVVLLVFTACSGVAEDIGKGSQKRNQIIGYMLDKELTSLHFSHKVMNEALSLVVFDLYLKQLDYQKRFLLTGDVTALRAFAKYIAADLEHGTTVLPETGYDIMRERIGQVEKMVDRIMASDFDVTKNEVLETDPQKIAYADDLKGLEDRWRKILKMQVMTRYLELEEAQKTEKNTLSEDELWKQAKEKEAKVDKDFFLRLHQETLQDHYDLLFNAIARAFDPHSDYLPPLQKDDFDIQMRGNLEGIGAVLRDENGFIKIVSIIPGSPAAKQGMLQAEDIILQVAEKGADPVDITDMRPGDAARLIRGPKGTEVLLTVKKPDGVKKVVPIVRDVVQIEETFVKHAVLDAPDGGKVGYILIPSFYRDFEKSRSGEKSRNVTDDTREAIKELTKNRLEGIILDLRNDGGGSLVDAVNVAGLFITSGPIVQVKDGEGKIQVLSDEDDTIQYSGPLVVLVNNFSASASEIVAAALQDYKRAIIIGGEHTYGKGTVQTIINLNDTLRPSVSKDLGDLGVVKLTIQKFYRITGGSTQFKGVVPDITLPSLFQHLQSGEKYLDNPLPWDQIGSAKYTVFHGDRIDLDRLRKKSEQRVEHDTELQTIAMEAKRADARSKQTAVSLQLGTMRQRVEEAREDQKKLSPQLRDSQAEPYDEQTETIEGDDTPKPGEKNWKQQLAEDPYLGEAAHIFVDMK